MEAATKKKKPKNWKRILFIYGGLAWPIVHFLFFWFASNFGTLLFSFFGENMNGEIFWNGFEAYKDVFRYLFEGKTISFIELKSFSNTITVILLALFINLPITLLFSYMLYRKICGHSILQIGLYVPVVLSAVILSLFFRVMFSGTATYNSVFTLLEKWGYSNEFVIQNGVFTDEKYAWKFVLIFSIWTGITGNIIYFNSAMARLPDSVIESSELDGATQMRQFFSIVLPMIWPTITTMGITLISGGLAMFMPPMMLVGESMAGSTGSGTIAWIITSQVTGGVTVGFPAALGVLVSIVFGCIIIGFKKGMEKIFEEVTY